MRITISNVLSAFNSESGAEVAHDKGNAMVAFADSKSAYGRAVRDITVVALSGRWRDARGEIVSDNNIGHAFGIPVRQPRARLSALTASGLKFESDEDIKANAAVWAHVSKMYNAGKDGRQTLKDAAETIAAIVDVDDKRAAWLATAIPARVEGKRAAQPDDGSKAAKSDEAALSESDGGAVSLPTDTAEKFSIAESETSTLLSYFVGIGTEITNRFADMTVAERGAFLENLSVLSESVKYAVKSTAKK